MKSTTRYDMSQAPTMGSPRSSFDRSSGYKTGIDFDYIYPVYWDEVYPGDTFTFKPNILARLSTPLYPLMDNMFLDIHSFYIPLRQLWDNSRKFFGEQVDPGDSIDYTIPTMTAPAVTGYGEESLSDYFRLPTKVPDYEHSAIYHRAYAHCYNEWFRDQNLVDSVIWSSADGPDTTTNTSLLKRGKRHDYFTSCLTSPQKGDAVDLPLGTTAPIEYIAGAGLNNLIRKASDDSLIAGTVGLQVIGSGVMADGNNNPVFLDPNDSLYVDLNSATAATVVQLREAMAIQRLLELDARAGTRYNEIVYSTFGVRMVDMTYKPEFLGGGSVPIGVNQVAQTSNDGTNGSVGQLGAFGSAFLKSGGWTKSFTEHGVVLTVVSARADITYQQGLDKLMSRSTRYDFLYPILQNIGDDAVLVKEIYCDDPATDTGGTGTPNNERVFGYQERYAELKYKPSAVTGRFRSNCTQPLDPWHLAEEFASMPSLDQTFIECNTPIERALSVTTEPHLILDCYFDLQCARPMHMYSIPGMGSRF